MSKKRGKSAKKLLGSHQRSWIWGRRAVIEILEAGRWPAAELYLDETMAESELDGARRLAEGLGVAVRLEPAKRLFDLCHAKDHQGYLAKMLEFPYADAEEILSGMSAETGRFRSNPIFAVLDSIRDSFNFGAIVRSAETLGVDAVFIGERGQSPVTSQTARSSAGAVNRVPIARVADLAALAAQLRERGAAVVAADEKSDVDCADCDFRGPAAIVLGNESEGVSPELLEVCDARVRIPQSGAVGSLNVAVAAGILFYEIRRQRNL